MPDFIARFIRTDEQPDEEYFYQTAADAQAHMNLFNGDDSGLYRRIEVVQYSTDTVIASIEFKGVQ